MYICFQLERLIKYVALSVSFKSCLIFVLTELETGTVYTSVTHFLFLLQYIQLCVAHPGQLPARLEKLVRTLICIIYVKHKGNLAWFIMFAYCKACVCIHKGKAVRLSPHPSVLFVHHICAGKFLTFFLLNLLIMLAFHITLSVACWFNYRVVRWMEE